MKARVNKTSEVLVEPLTRREREVLVLLAKGYSAPEIAQQLTLALSSVKWYVQQVYGKLGVNNKQRAVLRAGALGLLETPSPVVTINSSPKHNLPSQLASFIGFACALFGLAILVALISTLIRCESCGTLFYKHLWHGLPLGYFAMLTNRCPVCGTERA